MTIAGSTSARSASASARWRWRSPSRRYLPDPAKSCSRLEPGLQMTGAMVLRLAAGHRETDRGAERDPVGVLARDVAAVNQVDRENLVRPVTHAGLKPRLDHAWRIRLARLPKGFDGPLQGVGELPVETRAIGEEMPIGHAVPQPAAIEVDPHGFGQPVRHRHDRERSEVFPGQRIECAAGIERQAKPSDAGWN